MWLFLKKRHITLKGAGGKYTDIGNGVGSDDVDGGISGAGMAASDGSGDGESGAGGGSVGGIAGWVLALAESGGDGGEY